MICVGQGFVPAAGLPAGVLRHRKAALAPQKTSGAQFCCDLSCNLTSLIHLAGLKADRAHPRMPAAAIALTNRGQIMPRFLGRPRIRSH